jgi:hypothetical protein
MCVWWMRGWVVACILGVVGASILLKRDTISKKVRSFSPRVHILWLCEYLTHLRTLQQYNATKGLLVETCFGCCTLYRGYIIALTLSLTRTLWHFWLFKLHYTTLHSSHTQSLCPSSRAAVTRSMGRRGPFMKGSRRRRRRRGR